MAENKSDFKWTLKGERAAQLVAGDFLTDADICKQIGVSDRTLYRWKRYADFNEHVSAIVQQIAEKNEEKRIRIESIVIAKLAERLNMEGAGKTFPLSELVRLYLGTAKGKIEYSGTIKHKGEIKHRLEEREVDSIIEAFFAGYDTRKKEGSRGHNREGKKSSH